MPSVSILSGCGKFCDCESLGGEGGIGGFGFGSGFGLGFDPGFPAGLSLLLEGLFPGLEGTEGTLGFVTFSAPKAIAAPRKSAVVKLSMVLVFIFLLFGRLLRVAFVEIAEKSSGRNTFSPTTIMPVQDIANQL